MNLNQFIAHHKELAVKDRVRLGQRFVNDYIKGTWPELFYQPDDEKAEITIREWLVAHHYFDQLPEQISN